MNAPGQLHHIRNPDELVRNEHIQRLNAWMLKLLSGVRSLTRSRALIRSSERLSKQAESDEDIVVKTGSVFELASRLSVDEHWPRMILVCS